MIDPKGHRRAHPGDAPREHHQQDGRRLPLAPTVAVPVAQWRRLAAGRRRVRAARCWRRVPRNGAPSPGKIMDAGKVTPPLRFGDSTLCRDQGGSKASLRQRPRALQCPD